ncbi:hypothetical protein HH310_29850 [Actinoplanes sp. TBRC 11911]|uniref:hypothetical protein n=1 Tax=Actinoplanes sp. TBRC 11911 TaxID=2729386 RepID=UPI00145FCD51|nr:hypothetical protein [Actinoplanes sp. TBRC 11911]NMO55374.1 hypothetical protein [Actinoplanes sp. TBRC 11911]
MSDKIGADTELLNGRALDFAMQHMNRVVNAYQTAIAMHTPLGQQRSDTDKAITASVNQMRDLVGQVLGGITDLSKGDISKVDSLRSLLENAEDDNIREAGGKGGRAGAGSDKNGHR